MSRHIELKDLGETQSPPFCVLFRAKLFFFKKDSRSTSSHLDFSLKETATNSSFYLRQRDTEYFSTLPFRFKTNLLLQINEFEPANMTSKMLISVISGLFVITVYGVKRHLNSDTEFLPKLASVAGNFPFNPNYTNIKFYSDAGCEGMTYGQSVVLETCLVYGPSKSQMYTCGKITNLKLYFRNQVLSVFSRKRKCCFSTVLR
jgi:hypothetical protein